MFVNIKEVNLKSATRISYEMSSKIFARNDLKYFFILDTNSQKVWEKEEEKNNNFQKMLKHFFYLVDAKST